MGRVEQTLRLDPAQEKCVSTSEKEDMGAGVRGCHRRDHQGKTGVNVKGDAEGPTTQ